MVAWFDSVILNWFQSIQNEFLTVLFKAITLLGEGGLIWIALGLCLVAYKKTRWVGISVLLALLFSLLVGNLTLKPLVARPRPCWRNPSVALLIQNPKDYSFPSGHSLSSFAAAMAIFMNHRKMGVAALLFAFIMGGTRLYFYVHYPTDVLAGMLFGLILGFLAYRIVTKGRKNGRKEAVLELEKLQKSYRKNEVLRDVSITVKDGESVCFVGANGAGKSTLLKIIVGALKPDAGTILWNGKAVDGTFLSEHVGYVPQENPLFGDLTVKDNLELWYANDKARMQKDLEDGWLFYFGMHKIYKKPVKKLSGGMKKRLSICCALAGDPDVLVMDEPGAALDLMAKNEILRLIKNFTRKGKSVIIASHEMSEIMFCDSLYGIRDGSTVTLDKEINSFELMEWIQG